MNTHLVQQQEHSQSRMVCSHPALAPLPLPAWCAAPCHEQVRLQSISITAPADQGPKLVKLYVNRASMGFSDADSVPCAEQFTLTPAQLEGEPLTLKPVKFGNVDLLTILVDSNQVGALGPRWVREGQQRRARQCDIRAGDQSTASSSSSSRCLSEGCQLPVASTHAAELLNREGCGDVGYQAASKLLHSCSRCTVHASQHVSHAVHAAQLYYACSHVAVPSDQQLVLAVLVLVLLVAAGGCGHHGHPQDCAHRQRWRGVQCSRDQEAGGEELSTWSAAASSERL